MFSYFFGVFFALTGMFFQQGCNLMFFIPQDLGVFLLIFGFSGKKVMNRMIITEEICVISDWYIFASGGWQPCLY